MERSRGARARYQADREAAASSIIPNISRISPTEGDGEFTFTYTSSLLNTEPSSGAASKLEIRVIPQEFSSYPKDHFFIVFANSQNVSPTIARVLDEFVAQSVGMKVQDALAILSQRLTVSLTPRPTCNCTGEDVAAAETAEHQCPDGSPDDEGSDSEDFEDFDFGDADNDDEAFGLEDSEHPTAWTDVGDKISTETAARIVRDFQTVRRGGFFISKMCGFESHAVHHIVSISVRVDKLCLSEEVISAWNLLSTDFIVLLVRYHQRYKTFEQALENPAPVSSMEFRLRKCTQYKTSAHQACKSFDAGFLGSTDISPLPPSYDDKAPPLNQLGVGESVDKFMKREFIHLLKLKYEENLTWDDAKKEYDSTKDAQYTYFEEKSSRKSNPKSMEASTKTAKDMENKLPAFVAQDHVATDGEKSLPLIAMQFALRHFLRCTDYCMVCFRRLQDTFEALKPYVCSTPLCLFQYMNLGLGPSIDLEVLNHPNVVDLLISFCWAALQGRESNGLREFPNGLNLRFPKLDAASLYPTAQGYPFGGAPTGVFDHKGSIITFSDPASISQIREGDWVAIVLAQATNMAKDQSLENYRCYHGRVCAVLEKGVMLRIQARHTLPISGLVDAELELQPSDSTRAWIVPYDQNFDDLENNEDKKNAIRLLLATTPSVNSMRDYLKESSNNRLEKWDRLSPSASKLARWIVASNRSSIVQVDQLTSADVEDKSEDEASLSRHDERITGMAGWIQFRFAQGSPEKEVQFRKEVAMVQKSQKTILGWHGSPLSNWHSIIRNGLDFKNVANGRSYGHGVYFAAKFAHSLGYTGLLNAGRSTSSAYLSRESYFWPNSRLQINSAISLNEIVNKPSMFVHAGNQSNQKSPTGTGIYVVDKVTWIQCRYLFVNPRDPNIIADKPSDGDKTVQGPWFVQDPNHMAYGPDMKQVKVPKIAIPSAREHGAHNMSAISKTNAEGHAMADEIEDLEDTEFLFGGQEGLPRASAATESATGSGLLLQTDKTDFRPATLDLSTLPQLAPPAYATAQAQKTIGQEIKKLQKVQATTPVHELGWYIDFDNISNMFHWIVELHSFDSNLLLAKDMKNAGVASIVLEIRFGRNYPLSPPFLRVIRPRFLPFMSGGGGHVTAGGAMCMELLTNTGWSPANSMESILVQVRLALCSEDPAPARLAKNKARSTDYGINEAYEAYVRAATTHGWQVPADLKEATMAMMSTR